MEKKIMETEKIPLSLIEKAKQASEILKRYSCYENLLVAFDSETELINFYKRDTGIIVARIPY
jgi:hypothetical protein